MIAVVDSNTLIGLAKGGVFHILGELFQEVRIPPGVWQEVVEEGTGRPGAAETLEARSTWLTVERAPANPSIVFPAGLEESDREVILLAQGTQADRLVTDDRAARSLASTLGLNLLYTAEIILAARHLGLITACRGVFNQMRSSGFGIRDDVYQRVLRLAGEE